MRRRELQVGTSRHDGRDVTLSPPERSTHVHVVGASGSGKSRFLEHLIRQDAASGHGLCLIDPHGHLFDRVRDWIALKGLGRYRQVRLFQPTREGWSFGFNPLPSSTEGQARVEYAVDAVVNTLASVWGGEDTTKTPRLRRCLKLTLYALASHDLTLAEAGIFTATHDPDGLRRSLTEAIADPFIAASWDDLNARPARTFAEEFESTNNRFFELLASSLIRRTVGSRDYALDTRRAMDEGDIVLVDLSDRGGQLSRAAAQTLGALLIGDFMLKARGREDGARAFHLYVDEAHRYLTPDVLDVLFEARKFGLHLTLAHQSLAQLGEPSGLLYRGVMAGAQTKVMFRLGSFSDARPLAQETMVAEIDPQKAKRALPSYQTIGHRRIWLRSEAETTTDGGSSTTTDSWAETDQVGTSVGSSSGSGTRFDDEGEARGTQESEITSETSGYSSSTTRGGSNAYGSSWSTAATTGTSEALQAIIEKTYNQVYSLDEQLLEQAKELQTQARAEAILRRPTGELVRIKVPHVEDRNTALSIVRRQIERFDTRALDAASFSVPTEIVAAEMEARAQSLIGGPPDVQEEPEDW